MFTRQTLYVGLIVLAGLLTCRAETYYVATNGLDSQTGIGGWGNAVATISNAAAKANKIAGSEILVSNGTYNITVQMYLSNSVTCRGFSGDPRDVIVDGCATARGFIVLDATLASMTVTNGYPPMNYDTYGSYRDGGGIWCDAGGTVSNCIITGNTGRIGGGLRCAAGSTVTDCRIIGNSASAQGNGQGGGASVVSGQFRRNVVQGNFAAVSAGGVTIGGSLTMADCTIAQNTTTNTTAGGICDSSSGMIVNCQIISNVCAPSGVYGYGGGSYVSAASSTYSNCVFAFNSVTNGNGGGVYHVSAGGPPQFFNCLVYSNTAQEGGGAFFDNATSSRWFNCTFTRNWATRPNISGQGGGGLFFRNYANTKPLLVNCISYDNFDLWTAGGSSNYFADGSAAPVFSNCCSMPSGMDAYGSGNIATNPVFKAPADYNFRLARESPCLNVGLNQEWMIGAVDLDGHARIDRFKRQVDMGAYEYVFPGTMFTVY